MKPVLEHSYQGSELVLVGVDRTNPFIYDNDIFTDTVDLYFDAGLSKLYGGTMKGIVVTYNILEPNIPFQSQVEDAIRAVERCRASNLAPLPEPLFGAWQRLARPPSGAIDDTPHFRSEGADAIVAAAHEYGRKDKPLIVFVGGQATTVASAYLQDHRIAEKVLVCHIDPLGYNGADSWATWICARTMRYFAWGSSDVWWWSGTLDNQVILDPAILPDSGFDSLPDNPLCTYLKTTYKQAWPNSVYHDLGDGAIAVSLVNRAQFPAVQRQAACYRDGRLVLEPADGEFDVLAVSEMSPDNKRRLGATFFEIMRNPLLYKD